MKKKFKPALSKYNLRMMSVWVGVFAMIGIGTLLLTFAATPSTQMNGTSTTCVGLTNPAFCESFDQPFTANPSWVRTGDLNSEVWGVSRSHNQGNQGVSFQWYTPKGYVGKTGSGAIVNNCAIGFNPQDVKICNGRLVEAVQDGGNDSKTTLAIYPKQPFNWAGRTGTIVFDVTPDSKGPHTAWPELWVTNLPTPTPGADGHGEPQYGWGMDFSGESGCDAAPNSLFIVNNWVRTDYPTGGVEHCPIVANANSSSLNHVRVTVNQNRIEVFMTDPGGTTEYKVASYGNIDLPLSQGLVWMQDGHYNACKDDVGQCDHAIAWDNFGFDGPKTYRDLSFDAADNHAPSIPTGFEDGTGNPGYYIGWYIPANGSQTITVKGVHNGDKTPTAAYALFNSYTIGALKIPDVSLNGGAKISSPWVYGDAGYTVHSNAVPIPLSQIKTDGSDNTLTFSLNDNVSIANVNIVLVNAQTVPGASTPGDTTKPTVSLTAPASGAAVTIGNPFTASATASDNVGVTKVEFYVGNTLKATDTTAPYSTSISTTGMTAGTYDVTAVAYDAANNQTSTVRSITLSLPSGTTTRRCDINNDGGVNILDLSMLLSSFGKTVTSGTGGDCRIDGKIDVLDLSVLLSQFGS